MTKLKDLALINLPPVNELSTLDLIEKSFMRHKSLEMLNVSGNKLPNYNNIVTILLNNKHIQSMNVRG